MKIIVALSDNNYFLWQMLVQINNFRKLGFEEDLVYVIGNRGFRHNSNLEKIINNGKTKCSYYVLKDDRESPQYSSSLRPHILKKLFKKHPEFEKETIFYIDPDVLFTKKIRFSDLEKNDIWYLSDTRSYIGVDYIKSKGIGLFYEMCKTVGISPDIVEKNDENAGGAQYLMKNVDWKFWEEVEKTSEELFQLMVRTANKYNPEHPIQAWTADMWAVLWVAWKYKHETKIVKRFDFSWATDKIEKWDKRGIYHNAGVVSEDGVLFNKIKHQISPFNKKLECSDKYCSYNYVKEIKETEKNFKQILF
jgi:hypothetical protein